MKPTEEQLKDPQWWDENAPEGYDFFIIDKDDEEKARFHRLIEGFYYDEQGCYWRDIDADYLEVYTRPEPEWQPKVGDVCLARSHGSVWKEVELLELGSAGKWACYFETEESHNIFLSDDIRPLPKSPREQFVEKAAKQFDYQADDLAALYDLAMEFK